MEQSQDSVIAEDGKVVRGSKFANERPAHLVSAFLHMAAVTVGQVQVEDKSNEIPDFRSVFEPIDLKDKIVFLVGYEHELDIAKPEDAPVIRGMTTYLNDNKSSLSPQAVAAVYDLIARWKSQLRTYMNTYTPSYQAYVENARVDARNNLVPGTAILYAEEDGQRLAPRR
jgi:hypothetical protein